MEHSIYKHAPLQFGDSTYLSQQPDGTFAPQVRLLSTARDTLVQPLPDANINLGELALYLAFKDHFSQSGGAMYYRPDHEAPGLNVTASLESVTDNKIDVAIQTDISMQRFWRAFANVVQLGEGGSYPVRQGAQLTIGVKAKMLAKNLIANTT
jgi:hypothetical protein